MSLPLDPFGRVALQCHLATLVAEGRLTGGDANRILREVERRSAAERAAVVARLEAALLPPPVACPRRAWL